MWLFGTVNSIPGLSWNDMVSLALTLAVVQTGPEFPGASPGTVYGASRASKPAFVDSKLICGLIEVPDAMLPLFGRMASKGVERQYLPIFASKSSDKSLIALPYATDERYRNITLSIAGKEYPVRLPVSTAFGSSERKPAKGKLGYFTVDATLAPWRYTTENFSVSLSISPVSRDVRLLSYAVHSSSTSGKIRGYETIVQDSRSPINVMVSRTEPYNMLSLKATELIPQKIQLKVKKPRGGKPEYYALDGRKIYSANNKLSEYLALKVRNIYYIDGGIAKNRPLGNAASYALLKDGDMVEATGYKAARSEEKASLKLDIPKPAPPQYRHALTAVMMYPRKS